MGWKGSGCSEKSKLGDAGTERSLRAGVQLLLKLEQDISPCSQLQWYQ